MLQRVSPRKFYLGQFSWHTLLFIQQYNNHLFRLLRGRLGIVQMLASLTIFNLAHADKCVDFLLSDNDKRQWKVQNIYFRSLLNLLWSRGDRLSILNLPRSRLIVSWDGRSTKPCWRRLRAPWRQSRRWCRWRDFSNYHLESFRRQRQRQVGRDQFSKFTLLIVKRVKRHRSLIFTDLTVHMIMVLLLLFPADDHDAKVTKHFE